jgi:hypothetical protein
MLSLHAIYHTIKRHSLTQFYQPSVGFNATEVAINQEYLNHSDSYKTLLTYIMEAIQQGS